jgi:hypothetical protein
MSFLRTDLNGNYEKQHRTCGEQTDLGNVDTGDAALVNHEV